MPDIRSGFVTPLYLFDVADAIDLTALRAAIGAQATTARLDDKSRGPSRLRYIQPPVVIDGRALGHDEIDGFRLRIKFYDYGVISLMLSRPFSGGWGELLPLGQALVESEPLEDHATRVCHRIVEAVRPSLQNVHATFLSEDYLIVAVTALEEALTADELLRRRGSDLAQLLRGEQEPLSAQERDIVLRNALSYLTDDLVVPAWNATFIYDSEPAALAAIEILEFANSQLLEFRYHDEVLEQELTRLYAQLQKPAWIRGVGGRRHRRAALHVQALVIDINELTDRTGNAVKFVGDIYAARLFNNISARLGVDGWKSNVDDKLRTLTEIHQFAVEQSGISQANLLELAIVLILVFELGLFFAGIMQ